MQHPQYVICILQDRLSEDLDSSELVGVVDVQDAQVVLHVQQHQLEGEVALDVDLSVCTFHDHLRMSMGCGQRRCGVEAGMVVWAEEVWCGGKVVGVGGGVAVGRAILTILTRY